MAVPTDTLLAGYPASNPAIVRRPSLRSLIPRFYLCLWLVVIGLIADVAGFLLQVRTLGRLRSLVGVYGFGHIPRDAISDGALIDLATRVLTLGGYAVALAAFLVAMARARRIAQEAGLTDFQYGYGWTAGSLFIPFWNFSRPWVGLGEIRNAILRSATMRQLGNAWKTDEVGAATVALGLIVILANLFGYSYAKLGRLPVPHEADAFLAWTDHMSIYFLILAGMGFVRLGTLFLYLLTLRRPILTLIAVSEDAHPGDEPTLISSPR
jgi:hypothetical protein